MAIPKRLLSKLKSIYISLKMVSPNNSQEVYAHLARLKETMGLCRKGLPEEAYKI